MKAYRSLYIFLFFVSLGSCFSLGEPQGNREGFLGDVRYFIAQIFHYYDEIPVEPSDSFQDDKKNVSDREFFHLYKKFSSKANERLMAYYLGPQNVMKKIPNKTIDILQVLDEKMYFPIKNRNLEQKDEKDSFIKASILKGNKESSSSVGSLYPINKGILETFSTINHKDSYLFLKENHFLEIPLYD